ncbi:MAG: metallophosphoesterase [Bacteroidales bacterium]|nr:metallophosphoesterase [Bacteroidales bacterium]
MKILRWAFRIVIFSALIFLLCGLNLRLKVQSYTIETEKIQDTVRIAFITDFHSSYYGKNSRWILDEVDRFSPNLVLLGGDIFDASKDMERATQLLASLSKWYKTLMITGNHEHKSLRFDTIKNIVNSYGVELLEKETVNEPVNSDTIAVTGVSDVIAFATWENSINAIDSLAKGCNSNRFNILLFHRPDLIHQYLKEPFDLILMGHLHGGQFRIPWNKEGMLAPGQNANERYTGGLYKFGSQTAIVNKGLARGKSVIPRYFNRPEIVEITIVPKK